MIVLEVLSYLSVFIIAAAVLGAWVAGIIAVVNTARDRDWERCASFLFGWALGTYVVCWFIKQVIEEGVK